MKYKSFEFRGLFEPIPSDNRQYLPTYPGFRSLGGLGHSQYAVNINGVVVNINTGEVLTAAHAPRNMPKYSLVVPNVTPRKNRIWRVETLVCENFWDEENISGPFASRLLETKEYYLIPVNQKRRLILKDSYYSNIYVATIYGDIWNIIYKYKMTPVLKNGHLQLSLGRETKPVKNWMADVFLPNDPEKPYVILKDGDYRNVKLSNIMRMTRKEAFELYQRTLRDGKSIRYRSIFALTDFHVSMLREYYSEDVVQAALAMEEENIDYVRINS